VGSLADGGEVPTILGIAKIIITDGHPNPSDADSSIRTYLLDPMLAVTLTMLRIGRGRFGVTLEAVSAGRAVIRSRKT